MHEYARLLVLIGGFYQLIVFLNQQNLAVVPSDYVVLGCYVGLAALFVLRAPARWLAHYILIALFLTTTLSMTTVGHLGPTGPLLCTLPICAAVLLGPFGAVITTALCLFTFALLGWLYSHGFVPAPIEVHADHFSTWIWVATAFTVIMTSSTTLVGSVIRDLDVVSLEFEEARKGLTKAGELRLAAEKARDEALAIRNDTKSLEALGMVAGSVVHDLNNMAQVIRTWSDEIAVRGAGNATSDAAQSISLACGRLTSLASDVLALGRRNAGGDESLRLADGLPHAARALRRFAHEELRIVVDADLPENLPPLPIGSADLVHFVLEAAAILNIGAGTRGTLIVSAPRADAESGPPPLPGTTRHAALLGLDRIGAPAEARVHDVENHGVEKIVTLMAGEKLIHATVPARTELKLDEQVRFNWNPAKVVVFDGDSGVSLRHAG